jgi:hypothetical protein
MAPTFTIIADHDLEIRAASSRCLTDHVTLMKKGETVVFFVHPELDMRWTITARETEETDGEESNNAA